MSGRSAALLLVALGSLALAACRDGDGFETSVEPESFPVTAWGEHFEIFAEIDRLQVGAEAEAYVHVTILEGFRPMTSGEVEVLLRSASGASGESVFASQELLRPGIVAVALSPGRAGEHEILFRVRTEGSEETVPGGTLVVGDESGAGFAAPTPLTVALSGEPVDFLKEQQWNTRFSVLEVTEGTLHETTWGPAVVRPAAGRQRSVTAPVKGVVEGERWPFVGLEVSRGESLLRLVPLLASDRSLVDLEAEVTRLEAELEAAGRREARLENLLELEAVSRRELEEERARRIGLEARLEAAGRDLGTVRAGRSDGRVGDGVLEVRSPLAGRVAAVAVIPGEAVTAGQELLRIVDPSPLWVEVYLRPAVSTEVARSARRIRLHPPGGGPALSIPEAAVRFVGLAPEVDPGTGTVAAIFEVTSAAVERWLGAAIDVEIPLPAELRGVVVPESAVLDDAGIPIVFVQVGGESFLRAEVAVRAREGESVLVEGVPPGARLVAVGGDAIRRASLLGGDPSHGHPH